MILYRVAAFCTNIEWNFSRTMRVKFCTTKAARLHRWGMLNQWSKYANAKVSDFTFTERSSSIRHRLLTSFFDVGVKARF